MDFLPVIIAIASLIAGIAFGYLMRRMLTRKEQQSSENLAVRIVEEAKKEADNIKKEAVLQAKESLLRTKAEFEREARDRKAELDKLEVRLRSKEENQEKRIDLLVQKESNIENRERGLQQKENALHEKHERLNRIIDDQKEKLERIAGFTAEEAKAQLIQSLEAEAKREAAILIRKAEEEAKRIADKKAQEIIAYSIQRYAGDFVAESTVSVVNLPTDDISGIAAANRDKVLEIAGLVLDACKEPSMPDDVLKHVFDHYGLNLDMGQYALAGSTIRSYITYLHGLGKLERCFKDNRLRFRTV